MNKLIREICEIRVCLSIFCDFRDLTFSLPLSRLGIAQASLALLSLLHRFCVT